MYNKKELVSFIHYFVCLRHLAVEYLIEVLIMLSYLNHFEQSVTCCEKQFACFEMTVMSSVVWNVG